MDCCIVVFCMDSRSCIFFKILHHVDHEGCKAGISAEVLLAVMTQRTISFLISVHEDEALVLPGEHSGFTPSLSDPTCLHHLLIWLSALSLCLHFCSIQAALFFLYPKSTE